MPLPSELVEQFQRAYGIDPTWPVVVQVAPFDATFNPKGALEIYRRAKIERPDLQLVLVDSIAQPSLDAWARFERVARQSGTDQDAHMLCGQGDGGQAVINSAQRAAWVVLQRSVPAGFSLPVWEAFWKGCPVVAGRCGGLPLQVAHEASGYLASNRDEFVEHLLNLVSERTLAAETGHRTGVGQGAVPDYQVSRQRTAAPRDADVFGLDSESAEGNGKSLVLHSSRLRAASGM